MCLRLYIYLNRSIRKLFSCSCVLNNINKCNVQLSKEGNINRKHKNELLPQMEISLFVIIPDQKKIIKRFWRFFKNIKCQKWEC